MVYRFDPDWNGEIISQSRVESAPSYLGMYFPASDIPPQARRLYTTNLVRIVADIGATPIPIQPTLNPATGRPLDLSYSALRSLSPIHMEYLRNIGVQASMVMSLLQNGRLWGLIVCHHQSPKRISMAMRDNAILISRIASEKLTAMEATEHHALVNRATHFNSELIKSFNHGSVKNVLQELLPEMQALVDATGVQYQFAYSFLASRR